jgi:hypothetical protein
MVNYVKTTNGYFYKICKNGKKRISEDEYNKQRKIKKMTGGVKFDHVDLLSDEMERRNRNPKTLMDNVFATGHITIKNGKTFSCIAKISKELKTELDSIKDTENIIEYEETKITYVGEIMGGGSGHGGFTGMSNIWVQLKNGFVHYIVEINKIRNNDTINFGKLVYITLKTLCEITNIELLIKALSRIGVQLDGSQELIRITNEISTRTQALTELNQQKSNLYLHKLSKMSNHIDWTFNSRFIYE